MKAISSVILISLISSASLFAQTNTTHPLPPRLPFVLDSLTPMVPPGGNNNYIVSLTDEDFKNRKYVFYTDSNATVAFLRINGNDVTLTGGPNPEHIMAYTSKYFTATLSISKTTAAAKEGDADDKKMMKIEGHLCVYNSRGQMVAKDITGRLITAVKK